MKFKLAVLTSLLALTAHSLPAVSDGKEPNVIFIFDSSGSMKKKIDGGESRSDAAKTAIVKALADMPKDTKLGLMMYGHRRAKDCSDIELVSPPGANGSSAIAEMISTSQPKGETPIAASLEAAAAYFTPFKEQANSIVLVTDGVEECDGDPCAVARAIREAGTGLKAHVVGFTLNEQQRQTLQCVADETGGKYFDAQDATGLSGAMTEVQKAVADTPTEPVRERVFFDDFEGSDLLDHWMVNNPNPDGYIVEQGNLLMVNGELGGFKALSSSNLIQIEKPLPDGDWDIHVTFDGEFKSLKDVLEIGLRTDEKNFLSASVYSSTYNTGSSSDGDNRATMALSLLKVSNGTETVAEKGFLQKNIAPKNPVGFIVGGKLTLSKRGRSYAATLAVNGELDAEGKQVVHQTDGLTSLRPPGKFMLTAAKHAKATGEFQVNIASVEIETVKAVP